jgi:hypothetical protein
MIQKIKNIIKENRKLQRDIILQNKELDWANVYHDSIRGKRWLEELPLNIGRWAGNYSFFYVLNRLLNDYKPKSILEFGLGESSKFVMCFLNNILLDTSHLVIEQDGKWKENFIANNKIPKGSIIKIYPLKELEIKGFKSNSYTDLDSEIKNKFDLYIIDGPFGSKRYSRYDIVKLAEKFESNDEFVILFDDYNRTGEKDTVKDLLQILKSKEIKVYTESYIGNKTVLVIATEKYKYATSL